MHGKIPRLLIVAGGVIVALLMLLGFFDYLNSIGLPTGVVSFLIVLTGLFTLGTAGKTNYTASMFLILVGLFLFADSLGYLGSDSAPWLWPLFIVLFGILVLIFQTGREPDRR